MRMVAVNKNISTKRGERGWEKNIFFAFLGNWNAECNNAHTNFFLYATLVKEGAIDQVREILSSI